MPVLPAGNSLTVTSLPVGNDEIDAFYSGDASYPPAQATIHETVKHAPMVSLGSDKSTIADNQAVTFTALVNGLSNVTPTGTITFVIAGFTEPSVALRSAQAFLSETNLPAGDDEIDALYSGDDHYGAAQSTIYVTVSKTVPTTKTIFEYSMPTAGTSATGVTVAPDGNVWFTESDNKIGVINPTTGAISEFVVPTPGAITAGPDGNLWFTEEGANKIGMINPTTHAITGFSIPSPNSAPTGLTTGPDGNLWFTEFSFSKIGVINPMTGARASPSSPSPLSSTVQAGSPLAM